VTMAKRGNPKKAQGPPRSKLTAVDVLAQFIREGSPTEGIWWSFELEPGQSVEPGFRKKALDRLNHTFIGGRTWTVEDSSRKVRIRWATK